MGGLTVATTDSGLRAGAARVDITGGGDEQLDDPLYAGIDALRPGDRLYVRAVVIADRATTVVLVGVDAVAIAEIGSIRNDYLANVRTQLGEALPIEPRSVVINASHCHGVVCADIEARTVQAVREAWSRLVPVVVGVGTGHEDRIQENRRLRLSGGGEADVRHAYCLPPDEEIAAVGPIDPEIGLLRLDRRDGRPLAVVFNFACHPIQGVPDGGNTGDLSGFASSLIEEQLGEDAVALFVQGCAADINPILYRDTDNPRDAEPLGHRLGWSALRAWRQTSTGACDTLLLEHRDLSLPRADLRAPIEALEAERQRLLESLTPSALNLKSFLSLSVRHGLAPQFPSYDAHRYLHERASEREHLRRMDELNRDHLAIYRRNVHTMEQLTRLQVNLGLLRKNLALNAGGDTIDAEVVGLRVGDFVLVTFPGELSVETGLRIKASSPHAHTFVAGVTNGYLYYTPTEAQLRNRGHAQEDSDCLVAEGWEALFVDEVARILQAL